MIMNHSSQNNGDKCPLNITFFSRKSKEKSWMTNMNHSSQNSDDKWVTQWGKIFSEGPFLFSRDIYYSMKIEEISRENAGASRLKVS